MQVHEELHESEYNTYQRNEQLTKANDQLQAQHDGIKVELMKQQYEESQFRKAIEELCEQIPQCSLSPNDSLPQRIERIVAREKDIDESMEKMKAEHEARIAEMEVEHKDHIKELEARRPRTPPKDREKRKKAIQGFVRDIAQHIEEAQKLLEVASASWQAMDEFDDLVAACDEIQETQKQVDTISMSMKALPAIEKMLKMGEMQKLQEKLRRLQREEEHFLKIVQPWQGEVPQIALKVNEKIMEIKATQATIVSLLEEPISAQQVYSTRESVEKCKNDLAELNTSFMEFSMRVNTTIEEAKAKRMKEKGGSGMSHK